MSNQDQAAIETERSKANFTFVEALFPGINVSMDLKQIMISTHSEFQKIDVIETAYGKTLITDGKTQSTLMDEYIYHESLVHPPLLRAGGLGLGNDNNNNDSNNGPRTVFIGGGGELGTAREVLRHKSVERVVMVDLDEKVVQVCRKYMSEWGGEEVATNPRLELIIGDAYEYLTTCTDQTFDVIIMDISDPIEAGPGIMLYTQEFYQHAKTLLNENGVFVTQAGVADGSTNVQNIEPGSEKDGSCYAAITNTLNTVFDSVVPYSVNVPSFGSDWGFVMAFSNNNSTGGGDCSQSTIDYVNVSCEEVDKMVSTRITEIHDIGTGANGHSKCGSEVMRYYDGISHRRMFALPKPLRQNMKKDERIMTKANPVFMF